MVALATGLGLGIYSASIDSTPTVADIIALNPTAFFVPSDLSTLWQDSGGTTSVTSDNDPIGRVDDKSGNGNHLTQSTNNDYRPALDITGGVNSISFDGVDDFLGDDNSNLPSDCSVFMVIKSTDAGTVLITHHNGTDAKYLLTWSDGSVTQVLSTGAGSPSIYIDNVLFAGTTADDLHAAVADGVAHVVEARNANLSAWSGFYLSAYPGWHYTGKIGPILIVPTANHTAADRDNIIIPFLQSQMGIA